MIMHILLLMVTVPVPIHSLCVPGFLLCPVMEVTGPPQCDCSGNYTKEEDTLDCAPPAYVNKDLDRFIQNGFNCDNKTIERSHKSVLLQTQISRPCHK